MFDLDICPGKGKCHGPVNWCESCGDVTLTCDDPACDAHDRTEDLKKNAAGWAKEMSRSAGVYLEALRSWTEAEEKVVRNEVARAEGRVKMVPRKGQTGYKIKREDVFRSPLADLVIEPSFATEYVFADMQAGYVSLEPQGQKMTSGWGIFAVWEFVDGGKCL